jgi:hypothetical protein
MKQTKILMCALAVGAATFATSNVYALQGTVTLSGTALSQDSKGGYDVAKKNKITQKVLLNILAQVTGDSSITNHKTTVIYDPAAYNYNAWNSNEGFDFYGVFYYSNSVAGLTKLDGIDGFGDYYSYIELDFSNWILDDNEGFWSVDNVEYNSIFTDSKGKESATGNGILYIHSNPYDYDLPDGNLYYANDYFTAQQYAFVIRGLIQYSGQLSSTTESSSAKLSGSGDGEFDYGDLVCSGKATFKAKRKF